MDQMTRGLCAAVALCAVQATWGAGAQVPKNFAEPTPPLSANESVVTLETRPGISVRIGITLPEGTPRRVLIMFPGGNGFLLTGTGMNGRFRQPFARLGYASVTVDVPSDQTRGIGGAGTTDRFRITGEHAEDIRKVFDHVTARWDAPVVFWGHSLGAISAAFGVAALQSDRVQALILAGSPTMRGPGGSWISVPTVRLHLIKAPVLVMHHRDDGCSGAAFSEARRYPRLFTASPRVHFIEVQGGLPPQSKDPCSGNNQHSFFGMETTTARAIDAWLSGQDVAGPVK